MVQADPVRAMALRPVQTAQPVDAVAKLFGQQRAAFGGYQFHIVIARVQPDDVAPEGGGG